MARGGVSFETRSEIEVAPFDPALPLRHPEHQVRGGVRRHRVVFAELGHLIHLAGVGHLVEPLKDRPGAQHDQEVDAAAIRVHAW